MVPAHLLDDILQRLITEYSPEKIFLYGSQVWGEPDDHSDIDLCIILEHTTLSPAERIRIGLRALKGISVPVDLLVVTEDEIKDRMKHPSTLIHKVYSKGRVLYEAP